MAGDMSLSEYLTSTGFNVEKFDVPLQVWIDLDSKQNDEWFIIPEELIQLMLSETKEALILECIHHHFVEDIDFLVYMYPRVVGDENEPRMSQIHIKKRFIHRILVFIGTPICFEIHDYILDMRKRFDEYRLNQITNKNTSLTEEINRLKRSWNEVSSSEKFRIERELESKRLDVRLVELNVELKRIELESKRIDSRNLLFKK